MFHESDGDKERLPYKRANNWKEVYGVAFLVFKHFDVFSVLGINELSSQLLRCFERKRRRGNRRELFKDI